jgi:hypothetical protein
VFDVKKFYIYVAESRVWKLYDKIILPDGRVVTEAPGRYMKIIGNSIFGFEDNTEEVGERPDWDYNEPYCVVEDIRGIVYKTVKLKCDFDGRDHHVHLYYGRMKVAEFEPGTYSRDIMFTYIDRDEVMLTSLGVGGVAGGLTYYTVKNIELSLGLTIAIGIVGAILGFISGD